MSQEPPSPNPPTASSSLYKLPTGKRFIDLSDYARPLANHLVRWLVPMDAITPITVTLSFTVVGLASAWLIWHGTALTLAALLLPLKSLLDAADGSLARARQQPSQVGRFLDSFCDFIVNIALFLGLAHHTGQPVWLALAAVLAATWQGSVYNYYYVIKRHADEGDTTSEVDQWERPEPCPGDNPRMLLFLHWMYRLIYYWQDRLAQLMDPKAQREPNRCPDLFLTAISMLGLGFQLLVICVLILAGWAKAVFYYFTVVAMLYALGLVFLRRFLLSRTS